MRWGYKVTTWNGTFFNTKIIPWYYHGRRLRMNYPGVHWCDRQSRLYSLGFICDRLVGLDAAKWLLIIQGIGLRDKVQSSHFETIATCVPAEGPKDCWSKWIYMDGLIDNVQPIEMEGLYSNDIYNESDVNVFTPKLFGSTLPKPNLTHCHTRCFFAPHWLSVGQHVTAASRTGFWCAADRVGDLLNRCLRKTWWHQSLDSYKYARLPHCCHWCSNMFQPSFLYRISPTSYFLLKHPHFFWDWPFFQVQNLLRTHQLRHRLTMFSLSQESYHLVPTQKAPRVKSFGGGEVSLGHFDVFPRCVCWNSWLCVCFLRDMLI